MIWAHHDKHHKELKKVGYSRMKLGEAMSYEHTAKDRFQYHKAGLKEEQQRKELA